MKVLVTGGAGYVGSVLIPKLLRKGHDVTVIDLFLYGEETLSGDRNHPRLKLVKGDIRDKKLVERVCEAQDSLIHLACISNDPSFYLDPALGKSINYDATVALTSIAKARGVRRFIYASTSSVYGIKQETNVTEELSLEPLTDYSKYKAECEGIVLGQSAKDFIPVIIRPATVCGYSPRLRLDLTVNILTCHALVKKKMTIFGGTQKRPNIHIEDMSDLYCQLLEWPEALLNKETFNVGFENHTLLQIAKMVQEVAGPDVEMEVVPTNDLRSYHISSEKIQKRLGFVPKHTIREAISDLKKAFADGKIPNPLEDIRYYNIETMKAKGLK